jgi:hypothetical protein
MSPTIAAQDLIPAVAPYPQRDVDSPHVAASPSGVSPVGVSVSPAAGRACAAREYARLDEPTARGAAPSDTRHGNQQHDTPVVTSVSAQVLAELGVTTPVVVAGVGERLGSGTPRPAGSLGASPQTKRLLELSRDQLTRMLLAEAPELAGRLRNR